MTTLDRLAELEAKATKGPWYFRKYLSSPEDIALARKHGIEPVQAIDNGGERFVTKENGRVCLVDPTTKVKRGMGHKHVDDERDANSALIAHARNCLSHLLAVARAAKELADHVTCRPSCTAPEGGKCTCGTEDVTGAVYTALASLDAAGKEQP